MLLYNINTLHHRDAGSFSRINFRDASLVELSAPRFRSRRGDDTHAEMSHATSSSRELPHRWFTIIDPVLSPNDDGRHNMRPRPKSYCPCIGECSE